MMGRPPQVRFSTAKLCEARFRIGTETGRQEKETGAEHILKQHKTRGTQHKGRKAPTFVGSGPGKPHLPIFRCRPGAVGGESLGEGHELRASAPYPPPSQVVLTSMC